MKWSKADTQEQFRAARAILDAQRAGRTIVGTGFKPGDRVQSTGAGMLAVDQGEIGTVVAAYPTEQTDRDLKWTGQLEWAYSVRWDNRDWNNPGNKPAGCFASMLAAI